jgi:DNA-3-methyladenine glycosylase
MIPDLSNSLEGARNLLGWTLVHHSPAGDVGGIIIETEAYRQDDEASHTFRGLTKRTEPMFKEAGHIYMYFIYGMHWCMNIVTGPKGHGEAVLIRALKPTIGIELMKYNRNTSDLRRLANGPGSLVQALAIPPAYSGKSLNETSLELIPPTAPVRNILTSTRIGIKKATDKPWRFYIEI